MVFLPGGVAGEAELCRVEQHIMQGKVVINNVRLGNITDQLFKRVEIFVQIDTVDIDLSPRGRQITAHAIQKRGFSRSRTANDGNQFPWPDVHGNAVQGKLRCLALSPPYRYVFRVNRNTALIKAVKQAGGRIDQLGIGNDNDILLMEPLSSVDLFAVDEDAVGALQILDIVVLPVPDKPRVVPGNADMRQNDLAVLIPADPIGLLVLQGQLPPFVRGRRCGNEEQNAVRKSLLPVINADDVTVGQPAGDNVPVMEHEAVGARRFPENGPVLDEPLAVFSDKTAVG